MSQLSSQFQDPNWLSVPIWKFSHNTSPYGTRSFAWVHINNRTDLDLVIRNARVVDDYGNYQDRILMTITGGAEVLETQDLGQLVRFCKEFDPATGTEYPVDVVVKSPFMAMRYPKSINTVRRIQVKFRSDQDFKRTITTMKDLGLHLTYKDEAGLALVPKASPTPSLASSASAATGISHAFAESIHRPASSFTTPTSSVSERVRPVVSSPIKPEFKVPVRPDSAFSDSQGHVVNAPYSGPHITIPFSTSSIGSAIVPFSPRPRTESFHPPLSQNNSLYISQMDREHQNRRTSQPILPPPGSGNPSAHETASLYISQMQSIREEPSERTEGASRLVSASPFFLSTSNGETLGAKEVHSFNSQRPSSTPAEHSDIHQMWIPPKRELPFANPRKASNSMSSSASKLPTVLPKPTSMTRTESILRAAEASQEVTSTPVKKVAPKKRVAQRKAPNAKSSAQLKPNEDVPAPESDITEESIPKLTSIQEAPEVLSPLAAKSAAGSFRPASAPGLISKIILPQKKRTALPTAPTSGAKRPKMVDQSTQTQTLSGRDHTVAQSISSNSAFPDLVADTLSPASPPRNYLNELDSFIRKHNPQPKVKELWGTPGYAEVDEERRHSMLNDFICENLESADFLQLCRDAEFAWRRVGLGM